MKRRFKKMPRKKKKKSNMYFTQVHEKAIVEFSSTEDLAIREKLYTETIQPVFSQMVDKIVFTYRFTSLPDIDDLRDECKVYLATILTKFDPAKGSKAFSYFSVITKNWFIHKVKKNKKKMEREVPLDIAELDPEIHFVDKSETYQEKEIRRQRIEFLKKEMDTWKVDFEKDKEKKVYDAVMILFDSVDDIEIFNKKAIYLYLREITGMNTKQIVSQLNKMRKRYREFQKDWDNGEI
jgi:DNA-directed RNA polymerase specialized sigma24 family protein